MPESPDPLDSVDALLRSRADRGVFRSFAAARRRIQLSLTKGARIQLGE